MGVGGRGWVEPKTRTRRVAWSMIARTYIRWPVNVTTSKKVGGEDGFGLGTHKRRQGAGTPRTVLPGQAQTSTRIDRTVRGRPTRFGRDA
jgi:hypothetical protein